MTPATAHAQQAKIRFTLHEYVHDPAASSYGLEAAELLGVDPARVFKTLVADMRAGGGPKDLAVAVVPVAAQLDLKRLAKALGTKKTAMADKSLVERVTGYVLGGVSPLGQKKQLPIVIDLSAEDHETIYVSAGRRGLEIELSPHDLAALTGATFAAVARH